MSLSQKIAAALDETTTVHVLPCAVTVEDGPHRLTLHLTALDPVGVAFDALEFATTEPARVVARGAARPGATASPPA